MSCSRYSCTCGGPHFYRDRDVGWGLRMGLWVVLRGNDPITRGGARKVGYTLRHHDGSWLVWRFEDAGEVGFRREPLPQCFETREMAGRFLLLLDRGVDPREAAGRVCHSRAEEAT